MVSNGMPIAGFQFSPRILPTIAYLVILALLLWLGFWQLDRAEQKRSELAARAAATSAPVVTINEVQATLAKSEYRRARAIGEYDTRHQFLLDNRVEDGEVGYRVLTPFKLAGRTEAVLVDRGFIPMTQGRDVMPTLPEIEKPGEVTGHIGRGPSVGIQLGAASDNPNEWPRRVQYMDFDYINTALNYPVADYLLVEGSVRNDMVIQQSTREAWRYGPERHEGYAFQWFALATALTLIWVGVNTKRQPGRDHD
jgi:surfeit locus 1 family protein